MSLWYPYLYPQRVVPVTRAGIPTTRGQLEENLGALALICEHKRERVMRSCLYLHMAQVQSAGCVVVVAVVLLMVLGRLQHCSVVIVAICAVAHASSSPWCH